MIAAAERPGSLDAAIRVAEAADLRGLIAGLPDLQGRRLQRRHGGADRAARSLSRHRGRAR